MYFTQFRNNVVTSVLRLTLKRAYSALLSMGNLKKNFYPHLREIIETSQFSYAGMFLSVTPQLSDDTESQFGISDLSFVCAVIVKTFSCFRLV